MGDVTFNAARAYLWVSLLSASATVNWWMWARWATADEAPIAASLVFDFHVGMALIAWKALVLVGRLPLAPGLSFAISHVALVLMSWFLWIRVAEPGNDAGVHAVSPSAAANEVAWWDGARHDPDPW